MTTQVKDIPDQRIDTEQLSTPTDTERSALPIRAEYFRWMYRDGKVTVQAFECFYDLLFNKTVGVDKLQEYLDSQGVPHYISPETVVEMEMGAIRDTPDAGQRARAKLDARQTARKFFRKLLLAVTTLVMLVVAAIAGGGYYLWTTKATKYVSDERNCMLKVSDDLTIHGRRIYSYPYNEIAGIGWRETSKVSVETEIDIPSAGITVVGLVDEKETDTQKGGSWWAIPVGKGERGTQVLKPADTYVFHSDDNVGVVSSLSFCR